MSDSEAPVQEKKRGRGAAKAKATPVKNDKAADDVKEPKKRGRAASVVKNDVALKETPKKDVSTDEESEPVVKKARGRGRPAKGTGAAKKKALAAVKTTGAKKGRGRPPAAKKEEVKEEKVEETEEEEGEEEEGEEEEEEE